jgi:hypothetical protein
MRNYLFLHPNKSYFMASNKIKIGLKSSHSQSIEIHLSKISLCNETWKNIHGYPNHFISDYCRVWSNTVGRLLNGSIDMNASYLIYSLSKNGITTNYLAHYLVMLNFMGPRPKDQMIDHIDQDKLNNQLSNLRYVTPSDNSKNRIAFKRTGRPIDQLDLDGNYIRSWEKIIDAAKSLNITSTGISNCCLGKKLTYSGFTWQFSDQTIDGEIWQQFNPKELTKFCLLKDQQLLADINEDIDCNIIDEVTDKSEDQFEMFDTSEDKVYLVSNLGRIQQPSGHRSYGSQLPSKYVFISVDRILIHVGRIVCEVFHGPPPSAEYIADHIDEDRSNNRWDNLQWLSTGDNTRKSVCKVVELVNINENTIVEYASVKEAAKATGQSAETIAVKCQGRLRQDSNLFWRYNGNCKGSDKNTLNRNGLAINKFTLDGILIDTFPSISEAVRDYIAHNDKSINNTYIIECCKGQRDQMGGFKWEYVTPPTKINSADPSKIVSQYSVDGKHIKNFPDIDSASTELKIPRISLAQCCNNRIRSTHGFIFKSATDKSKVVPLSKTIYPTHYQKDGTLIKRYTSPNDAGKDMGVPKSKITSYILGSQKTSDGTTWRNEIRDDTTGVFSVL